MFSLRLSVHTKGEGYPSSRFFPRFMIPGPFPGGTPVLAKAFMPVLAFGYPSHDWGYYRTGVPQLGQEYPPPCLDWGTPWDRLHCRWYTLCSFQQEDFLVNKVFSELNCYLKVHP